VAGAHNAGGAWAVQVGAFASPDQARSAAQTAQSSVGGRVAVTSVQVGRSTLFRARVLGLNQGHAQQACDRLRAAAAARCCRPTRRGDPHKTASQFCGGPGLTSPSKPLRSFVGTPLLGPGLALMRHVGEAKPRRRPGPRAHREAVRPVGRCPLPAGF
jgi:hypothetical protein